MSLSVPTIIDYIIEHEAHGKTLTQKPSVNLYVASTNPLVFQDSAKNQLTVNKTNLETFLTSYNKIVAESSVLIEDCEVILNYGKNKEITGCDIHSKALTLDVNTDKASKVSASKFEIRLSLSPVDGLIPVLPSTRRYLRRMEKTDFFKKNSGKKATADILSFIPATKVDKKAQSKKVENFSILPSSIDPLDTNSTQILKDLLSFVDKEQLLRLLIKKPLKDKANKKAVRMMVVPTDAEDNETFEVRKKRYERNQIQQLLAEYEARDERMKI